MRCTVLDLHKDKIELATTAADIKRIVKSHMIAAFLTVEGGHTIDDDLRVLRMYYQLGIWSLTLTHSRNINWADSSTDLPAHNGLTEFGKEVVHEVDRLPRSLALPSPNTRLHLKSLPITSKSPPLSRVPYCN